MPTAVISVPMHNATDADFRIWGKAVSEAFASVGLVKVAETGSINWSTVTRPTAVNTAAGFEIWRFADALQSTHPVFIKIEYGSLGSLTVPGLWLTVGRSTDGAGAIAGVLAPRRQAQQVTNISTTSVHPTDIEPIYVSSDGSGIAFSARVGIAISNLHAPAFVVERSRDSTGTPTAAGGVVITEGSGGITLIPTNGASSAQLHAWTYAGDSTMGDSPATAPTQVNGVTVSPTTSLAVGDRAPVFPFVVAVPNHEPWQVLSAVAVMAGDAANGPFTANVLGRVRTYRSIPVAGAHNRWMSGNGPGYSGLCILWED